MLKIILGSLALALISTQANAASFAAYKCTSAIDAADVFPLFKENGTFRAATSVGSTRYFDLEAIDPAELEGWPVYPGGIYLKGNNDIWVVFEKADSLSVLKPLSNLPDGVNYACERTI